MKIIHFIRGHAASLAFLSVLMASIAAPYMIPENPDSAVFRSGTLGLILLMGCFLPVKDALKRAQKRELITSMAFGYLFAFALSLGSELYIYDGLLRGFGSFIRRMAVPVLATPLMGGLCCAILQSRLLSSSSRRLALPTWGYMLFIFLCWLPVWLAFWPANIRFDFTGEYAQHLAKDYSSLHPLLHSIIQNSIITLGEHLVSRTFGLALLTFSQMICLSFALGLSCSFIQKRSPFYIPLLSAIFFGFHPVFSVLAVSTTKDVMFTAAVVIYALMLWNLIESPTEFFSNSRKSLYFVIVTVFTALLRNNGAFALVFSLPAMVIAAKGYRKKAAILSSLSVISSLVTLVLLSAAFNCKSMSSRQFYSLPAQQLVRAYNLSPNMSTEDKEEIRNWYLSDDGLVLLPHLADPAKGYLDDDRLNNEGGRAFLSLWADHMKDSMHEYIEAFLMLNVGSWYLDDYSHALIYPEQAWNGQGYISLSEPGTTEQGFEMTCYLPSVRKLIQKICSSNRYRRIPIISLTFCPAFAFWLIALSSIVLIARKQTKHMPSALSTLGLWFSYLLGPCTLPRYALPLFSLAPILLCAALTCSESPVPLFNRKESRS